MSGSVAVAPTTGVYASQRWVLGLSEAIDRAVCGGKAVGLATLRRAGVPVPDGICLTTDFCRAALREIDVAARVDELASAPHMDPQQRRDRLAEIRRLVETASLPAEMIDVIQGVVTTMRARGGGRLAVRSSAVHEDRAGASHAGMHVTFIGPYTAAALAARVQGCWASLWSERAWAYREHFAIPHTEAAMAVVVQRFVAGGRAGIAFSADPMTAHSRAVVIEAAWGTGEAVVAGTVTPEHYRLTAGKETLTLTRSHTSSLQPVLTDGEIRTLGRLVARVERVLGVPADVEWTFDGSTFWVVQGRPIRRGVRHDTTLWTRANLKEVFPDQPS